MWIISAFHPFRLLNSVCFYSNIILVPVGYIKIFKYRKSLDSHVSGLTERARNLRKIRNLVNFKFNMFAWILDTASILLVIASSEFQILYLLVTSCGPPILYFLGMEENRRVTRNFFISCKRLFKING